MELPRDIKKLIISKLDIDTRRSLGIIVKLKIPENVKQLLSMVMSNFTIDKFTSFVTLGPLRPVTNEYGELIDEANMYTLTRMWFRDDNYCWHLSYNVTHVLKDFNNTNSCCECYQISSYDIYEQDGATIV